jgi:hypothetical protein
MQKRYGKFTRKALDALVTNGALYRAKAGKYQALNANADTNTRKSDRYYPAVQETAVETIEVKLHFQLHPTNQPSLFE